MTFEGHHHHHHYYSYCDDHRHHHSCYSYRDHHHDWQLSGTKLLKNGYVGLNHRGL